MATIAEFSIPVGSFALRETLPEFPDVSVEADRIVSHSPDVVMPCLWADDGNLSRFERALAADPTVAEIRATASFDQECLYHVEWSEGIRELVREMIDHEGVILEASGRDDQWLLRIRFMTREQFDAFREYFEERIPAMGLTQLFTPMHPRHTRGDVTSEQHEALTTAAELGYFAVPRNATIEEVAEELGISHQAVSERLRRGTENVVRDVLTVEPIQDRT